MNLLARDQCHPRIGELLPSKGQQNDPNRCGNGKIGLEGPYFKVLYLELMFPPVLLCFLGACVAKSNCATSCVCLSSREMLVGHSTKQSFSQFLLGSCESQTYLCHVPRVSRILPVVRGLLWCVTGCSNTFFRKKSYSSEHRSIFYFSEDATARVRGISKYSDLHSATDLPALTVSETRCLRGCPHAVCNV